MCGIAGIISKGGPVEPGRIEAMVSCLGHRGPDGVGFHRTPHAHVGMCRLAILDLRSEGLSPVVDTDGNGNLLILAYNGEIYNYVELRDELNAKGYAFRTTCDSEVLLCAYREWGEGCLERLNGMFAFTILDYSRDLLFAARDRAGEKPLYYFQNENQFIFASEIKAILTQLPMPELNTTDEFRAFEYMTGEETLFQGIFSLLPGHKLLYRGIQGRYKGRRISEYWNVLDHIRDIDPEKAVDELDELLQDAIRIRLRSDVPWGLYLSGGLDSSLIAHIAKPAICFSCHFAYGPRYDELQYAELVAREIRAEHVIIRPTEQDFDENMPTIMYHLDMPVGSFSIFPLFMLAREAQKHVKIVLSGEGSDEIFSGYTRYLTLTHDQELYGKPGMAHYKPLLDYYYGRPLDRFARLLNRGLVSDDVVKSIIAGHFEQFDDVIHAMGYTDFKLMLVTLLQMEDRASAAFGLENRSPFLDHRIIEFGFSIAGEMKIRDMTPKWILRQVAARYLSPPVLDRRDKMGLIAPINLWIHFRGRRGEFDREAYNKLCMEKWLEVFFNERRFAASGQVFSPGEGQDARAYS